MTEVLNWKNREWMEYFNEHRSLWTPVAAEWERLSKEYLSAKGKQDEKYTSRTMG